MSEEIEIEIFEEEPFWLGFFCVILLSAQFQFAQKVSTEAKKDEDLLDMQTLPKTFEVVVWHPSNPQLLDLQEVRWRHAGLNVHVVRGSVVDAYLAWTSSESHGPALFVPADAWISFKAAQNFAVEAHQRQAVVIWNSVQAPFAVGSSLKHPIFKQAIEDRCKACVHSNPQWMLHVFQSLGIAIRAEKPKDDVIQANKMPMNVSDKPCL